MSDPRQTLIDELVSLNARVKEIRSELARLEETENPSLARRALLRVIQGGLACAAFAIPAGLWTARRSREHPVALAAASVAIAAAITASVWPEPSRGRDAAPLPQPSRPSVTAPPTVPPRPPAFLPPVSDPVPPTSTPVPTRYRPVLDLVPVTSVGRPDPVPSTSGPRPPTTEQVPSTSETPPPTSGDEPTPPTEVPPPVTDDPVPDGNLCLVLHLPPVHARICV